MLFSLAAPSPLCEVVESLTDTECAGDTALGVDEASDTSRAGGRAQNGDDGSGAVAAALDTCGDRNISLGV